VEGCYYYCCYCGAGLKGDKGSFCGIIIKMGEFWVVEFKIGAPKGRGG